jgi:hypothetical protein
VRRMRRRRRTAEGKLFALPDMWSTRNDCRVPNVKGGDQRSFPRSDQPCPEPRDARAMRWIVLVAAVAGTTLTSVVDVVSGPSPWSAFDGGWLALLFFIARRVFPANSSVAKPRR